MTYKCADFTQNNGVDRIKNLNFEFANRFLINLNKDLFWMTFHTKVNAFHLKVLIK